eukprot:TRINITY_DN30245_c0_g1_i1.p1 TRINITY_DN30245_c0_g1~~TRINITY_DN30245_c0_g1_i1.p1  ORF type:complete len:267 (+),score=29.01 TRINITY_DN30245_c0_g1_i1:82-882(+)
MPRRVVACQSPSLLLVLRILSLWLTLASASDTWDIEVRLYKDANCFERADELLLLDQGCYANTYANNTKAFGLKIVGFNPPQIVQWQEYLDDCVTKATLMPRNILAGRCEKWTGAFWGILKLRFRSTVCLGGDCSYLTTINQIFYPLRDCGGQPFATFNYPTPGCMRFYNGTQDFVTNESGAYITQNQYVMSDSCGAGAVERRTYVIETGRCYPLYEDGTPQSFKWEIDETAKLVTGAACWRHSSSLFIFALASLLGCFWRTAPAL